METIKVLLITNIPTPYRIPLFNELSKQLEVIGMELVVAFGAMGYERRKWKIDMSDCKFKYTVLQSRKFLLFDSEKMIFSYSGLYKLINKEKPFLIITNGFSISTLKLWWRSFIRKTLFLIWSGAIIHKNQDDSKLRIKTRQLFIKKAKGFIAYGSKAKEYLISLGAKKNEITIAFNTVDTDFYSSETERLRSMLKRDPDQTKIILYVGHLTQRKRLDQLFIAIKELSNIRQDFLLKIVGDGAERRKLELLADQLQITRFISWEGFKQINDIPKYFAEAACFAFPSEYDIWGLVLVEAMASGVPCISSIYAGATVDLIEDGKTGFIIDFNKKESLIDKINWIFNNPDAANAIGLNAKNFVKNKLSLKSTAESIVERINYHL